MSWQKLTGSRGGLLFSARDRVLKWTSSDNLNDIFESYVEDGWFPRCPRRVCLFAKSMPAFFVEHDFWTADQLDNHPIYRDFFRPHGLGWSAGTGLQMPTGDHIVFSIERDHDRGPIERERVELLNELRSHLARSAFVAARLGLQTAKGANETLTAMGLPALLLSRDGTVIEANRLVETLSAHLQWRARNRVALAAPPTSFRAFVSAARRRRPGGDGGNSGRAAHDIFAGSYACGAAPAAMRHRLLTRRVAGPAGRADAPAT